MRSVRWVGESKISRKDAEGQGDEVLCLMYVRILPIREAFVHFPHLLGML